MAGTIKLKLLVIGKSKSLRCFKGVKHLPVDYVSNSNAWMTSSLFEDYLKKWDTELLKKHKNVVLVLDNCSAHPKLTLKNIELVFIPPNVTSLIQPLDQGIIKSFKTYYRSAMRPPIIQCIDDGMGTSADITKKLTVLDAFHLTSKSWSEISETCIKNCFIKSGFVDNANVQEILNPEVETSEDMSPNDFDDWVNIDCDLQATTALTDLDIVSSVSTNNTLQEQEEPDQTEDEAERILVTKLQTREAIIILRKALEEAGGNHSDYKHLYNVEKSLHKLYSLNSRQTKISEYLNNKL